MKPEPGMVDPEAACPNADNAKRRQILDGARRCFLGSGFDAASMGQIAREAKVSKGTLYVYFDSKEALFEALIEEKKRDTAERLMSLDDRDGPIAEVLTSFGAKLIVALADPDHVALVRMIIGASERFPELARTLYKSGPAHGAERLEAFLVERGARGEIAVADPEAAAWQFSGMCHHRTMTGAILGGLPTPDAEQATRLARQAVEVFLAAYGRRS